MAHDPKAKRPREAVCQGCGHDNRDGKIVEYDDGNRYCWACGHLEIAKGNEGKLHERREYEYVPQAFKAIPQSVINQYLEPWYTDFDKRSLLHHYLVRLSNKMELEGFMTQIMRTLPLGVDPVSGRTSFLFRDINQNWRYVKSVQYLPNGKRDKDNFPYAPYRSKEGFRPCLYGEHLLKDWKGAVNLVESEKTAHIAMMRFPNQLWLATAGSNGLTYEKAEPLRGRVVYKYVDCDEAGRKIDRDRKVLSYFNAVLKVKDVAPDRNDGTDIADLILEQL